MSKATPNEIYCTQCGAQIAGWDATCWLCKQSLAADALVVSDVPRAFESAEASAQFGLSTLMLVVTVVCICLGLIAIAPGLIIPLLVVVVPALIRSTVALRVSGRPVSTVDKVTNFVTSVGIILGILAAGFVALCVAFVAICFGAIAQQIEGDTFVGLMILAAIVALGLMVVMFYITWPRREKK
jgi:hypothetical protein